MSTVPQTAVMLLVCTPETRSMIKKDVENALGIIDKKKHVYEELMVMHRMIELLEEIKYGER